MAAAPERWRPVETLRRIWTPDREVRELVANLDPATEVDSLIRDFFCRMVQQAGSVRLDMETPNTGDIRWEIVTGPTGRREVTIWHVPAGGNG